MPSPTFNLMLDYTLSDLTIVHVDLYRLSGPDEVIELGLDEWIEQAALLIEWPERGGDLVPADRLDIAISEPEGDANRRRIELSAGPAWQGARLASLIAAP